MPTTRKAPARTPARRGRKPSISSLKDPGPLITMWYSAKKDLDNLMAEIGEIAEKMNTLGVQARTHFPDILLPFVTMHGQIESGVTGSITQSQQREPAHAVSPTPMLVDQHPVAEYKPPQQGPVTVTTGPMSVDMGAEGDVRVAAAAKMAMLQSALG